MLEYAFMLPVGIVVATIAMLSGIGGAVFFSPLFMLMGLEPRVALATGLLIEVAGFTSGLTGYLKRGLINFRVARTLLPFALIGTAFGVVLGRFVPDVGLKALLATVLLLLSYNLIIGSKRAEAKHPAVHGDADHVECVVDPNTRSITLGGGLMLGMVSSGLGEVNEYSFLKRLGMSGPYASGTSVLLVAVSAIIGIIAHSIFLIGEQTVLADALPIALFTVPGVLIGAQIGVALAKRLEGVSLEKPIGSLFFVLALVTIATI